MVTYPRTDSQYVTEDMKETVEMLMNGMIEFLPFLKSGHIGGNPERVINNAKVSDHHAILPTKEALENGMEGLSDGKKNLMLLIDSSLYRQREKIIVVNRRKLLFSVTNMNLLQRKTTCADGI